MTPTPSAGYAEILRGHLHPAMRPVAPEQLFLRGDESLIYELRARASVVGARAASARGLARAEAVARALVAHEVVVVSGLAAGIDAAAHRAAIAAGGRTVAVIGTPLDKAYPPEHAGLQAEIARDHLVVSQFADDPGPRGLALRNTTMAMWSATAIVVEAGPRSGARHHVNAMLDFGRDVYIHADVDAGLGPGEGHWVAQALKRGAQLYRDADVPWIAEEVIARGPWVGSGAFIARLLAEREAELREERLRASVAPTA